MSAAVVAAIMSGLELLELFNGWSFGIGQEWVEATLMVLTPFFVWAWPRWFSY